MRLTFTFIALLIGCDDSGGEASPPTDAGLDASADARPQVDLGFDARHDPDSTLDAEPGSDAHDPDAGDPDAADPDAAEADGAPPAAEGPAVYTADRSVAPITPHVAARLRAIAARAPDASDDVFAKVGASATVSRGFMHCFAGDHVDLDGRDALQATVDHFRAGDAAGGSPYSRESVSAVVGWSAQAATAGDPSPLTRELDAIDPRFAVVMYGTNDIQARNPDRYGGAMLDLVEALVARGVVPVLSSVMPRDDDPTADAEVRGYNGLVRAIAQGFQVPFVDLHRELIGLDGHGLGGDRLHPSLYRPGGAPRACVFTDEGLQHGYNWRNLLTITALHRALAALDGSPPDPPHAEPQGVGLVDDPVVMPGLPYGHLGTTAGVMQRAHDAYPSCDDGQDESGAEVVYRLDLDRPANIRAIVADRGDTDIDLHLLADPTDPGTCLARAHTSLRASLDAGSWYFVLDTWTGRDGERPGEYVFTVVEEPD